MSSYNWTKGESKQRCTNLPRPVEFCPRSGSQLPSLSSRPSPHCLGLLHPHTRNGSLPHLHHPPPPPLRPQRCPPEWAARWRQAR